MKKFTLHGWVPVAAGLAGSCLLLSSLAAFGIWDPWEVEISELARSGAHDGQHAQQAGAWLVSRAFAVFGIHEWSGRLPNALAGLLLLALVYRWVAAHGDRRTAAYAALIAGTSPLFIFNAVTMLGETPGFLLQTAIACCALQALFTAHAARRGLWMLGLALCAALGIATRGALLCVVPPLCAAALSAALAGRLRVGSERRPDLVAWLLTAASALLLLLVARDVFADQNGYSIWLGGAPAGGQPPSFDAVIERVFHAFAPWSALLPLGLGLIVAREQPTSDAARAQQPLALFSVLWVAFGYAALTLFLSRYGQRSALLPLAPMAIAVALLLRELERSRGAQWPAAVAALLLALLILRDYALYPISPMHGLPVADVTLPAGFNPRGAWTIALLPFCAAVTFGFGQDPQAGGPLALLRPYRWMAEQWRRGLGFKLWLLACAALLLGLEVFGALSFVPRVGARMTTLGVKVAQGSMLVPLVLAGALAALQLLLAGFGRLGSCRCVPMLIAGVGVALYSAFGFMPALSQQLSPRDVYDSYNRLAQPHESLAEYGVKGRAAAYYAKGKPIELDTLTGLIDHLAADERRWAVFPAAELTEIDATFRHRSHRHLFVADDRNARAVLVTNRAVPGLADKNALAGAVLSEPPPIATPLQVDFDDKIRLLGYKLELPHGDRVGQGEHFELTWYFNALRPVPGNYRVFVHIDGQGGRIGGDHDPVEGKYPVRLWAPGDVIVDRQRIDVAASSASGSYTIYMGLYSGDTRLPIKQGQHDPVDRAIIGALRIR